MVNISSLFLFLSLDNVSFVLFSSVYEIVARQEPHIDISILDVGSLIRYSIHIFFSNQFFETSQWHTFVLCLLVIRSWLQSYLLMWIRSSLNWQVCVGNRIPKIVLYLIFIFISITNWVSARFFRPHSLTWFLSRSLTNSVNESLKSLKARICEKIT